MNRKISVIVPVYNVEDYIERCVKSIQNQTYTELEIILIDDGSTDKSGVICDKLSGADDRIKVIHKQNQGVSAARNTGVDVSTGDFIAFVDSDDSIDEKTFEVLVSCIENNNLDVAAFKYYINSHTDETVDDKVKIVSREEALLRCVEDDSLKCFIPAVWNKLYRKAAVGKYLKFNPQYIMAEDMLVTIRVLMHAERIGEVDCEFYNYTQREESITNVYKKNKCSSIYAHEEMYSEVEAEFAGIARKIKIRSVEQAFTLLYEAMYTKELFLDDIKALLAYLEDNYKFFEYSDSLNDKQTKFFKSVHGKEISESHIRKMHRLFMLKKGVLKCLAK